MGISERKERERAEMRRRIVDAAMRMFVEEGYDKVSIRNIADKIEYSPATIYLYYKDKDELMNDVQEEAFAALAQTLIDKVTHKDTFRRMEQLADTYIQFAMENPQLYELMFILRAPMNAEENEHDWKNGDPAFNFLLDLVKEAIDKKIVRYKDPMVGTLSMWSFAHGLISLHIRCRFKVAQLDDEALGKVMQMAIKEYLQTIKA